MIAVGRWLDEQMGGTKTEGDADLNAMSRTPTESLETPRERSRSSTPIHGRSSPQGASVEKVGSADRDMEVCTQGVGSQRRRPRNCTHWRAKANEGRSAHQRGTLWNSGPWARGPRTRLSKSDLRRPRRKSWKSWATGPPRRDGQPSDGSRHQRRLHPRGARRRGPRTPGRRCRTPLRAAPRLGRAVRPSCRLGRETEPQPSFVLTDSHSS